MLHLSTLKQFVDIKYKITSLRMKFSEIMFM